MKSFFNTPRYVTEYDHDASYHHEEGGYYHEIRRPVRTHKYNTWTKAFTVLHKQAREWKYCLDWEGEEEAEFDNPRHHIGEGFSLHMERQYGANREDDEPYC